MAKNPHFFKAKSRIGLTNPPIRNTELNNGVEDAPDFILTSDFLQKITRFQIDEFIFSNPEDIKKDYWLCVAKESEEFKDLINQNIKPGESQVVLGGDNTVTLPSLEAHIERVGNPGKIGYIQFDSHGEMHQSKTSISKNFHGMYMRPFFDKFDIPEVDRLVPFKMKTTQILTVGDLVFDGKNTEEEEFYKKNDIKNISRKEFESFKTRCLTEISQFLKRYEYIHVNFDIDVFHRSVSEATGLPEDGNWLKADIFEILEVLAKKKNLSIDLVEVNPQKNGSSQTIKLAQKILLKFLC